MSISKKKNINFVFDILLFCRVLVYYSCTFPRLDILPTQSCGII